MGDTDINKLLKELENNSAINQKFRMGKPTKRNPQFICFAVSDEKSEEKGFKMLCYLAEDSSEERDSAASSFNDETSDFNSYIEAGPDLFCSESQPGLFCAEAALPPSPGPSNVSDPLWGQWERRQRINKEYQQQEGKKRTETPE
ncbi:hypothetical protein CDAR_176931 [Caerostris darwini]|uniref:Uncharacterized protein n=1 Tax=Caerostris darwini TaxID=1538125 RepID=A0AAV4RII0_9ARAC|nr:hypothetical protein CDAR_176931 [Caerostris darwini]